LYTNTIPIIMDAGPCCNDRLVIKSGKKTTFSMIDGWILFHVKHCGGIMAARQKKAAVKKKKSVQPAARRRFGWRIALAILGALLLLLGYMHLNANIVHVRYAEVLLDDLPASFDGTQALFASDFDLCGLNTARDAEKLFDRLQPLNPDMLLLGGDYASPSLIDRLNGRSGAEETAARKAFFEAAADFHAPLGKFAVSGDNDGNTDTLKLVMTNSGVELIDGRIQTVSNGTDSIYLAGVGEGTSDVSALANQLSGDQFVIALMHRPSRVVDVRIAEARGGGQWADLSLAGHTHGGQIRIGSRTLLSLTEAEKRCIGGWSTDGGILLVTEGVGCESVNLRFGSRAEVWLITLRCK